MAIEKEQPKFSGHVPLLYTKVISMFLKLPNTSVQAEVIGERINRGNGYGLGRTSSFISLLRPRKRCKLAQEKTKITDTNLEKDIKHRIK